MTSNSSKEFSIMGIFKTLALGAGLAMGLTATAGAETLRVRIYEGSINPLNVIPGGAGTQFDGDISVQTSNSNFSSIIVAAQGVATPPNPPVLPSPNLSSVSISATSTNLAVATTLIVVITQQNLSSAAPQTLLNSFTANVLNGGAAGYSSMTLAHYINANNCTLCQQTLMASVTYSGAGPTFNSPALSYLAPADTAWSEAMVYTINFNKGPASISITSQIEAQLVPEPMTIALLGAGLLGLGVARSRRKA